MFFLLFLWWLLFFSSVWSFTLSIDTCCVGWLRCVFGFSLIYWNIRKIRRFCSSRLGTIFFVCIFLWFYTILFWLSLLLMALKSKITLHSQTIKSVIFPNLSQKRYRRCYARMSKELNLQRGRFFKIAQWLPSEVFWNQRHVLWHAQCNNKVCLWVIKKKKTFKIFILYINSELLVFMFPSRGVYWRIFEINLIYWYCY